MQGYAQEAEYGVRSKKPFCNAFTGCGRKRADPDVAEGELLGLLAERIQGIRDQVGREPLIPSLTETEYSFTTQTSIKDSPSFKKQLHNI